MRKFPIRILETDERGSIWEDEIRERLFVISFRHLSLDPAP